ncbi:hypothetical protein QVZ41_01455 [Wenyingzhuangia sp. chi5]|uniref:Membrane or secreted protein n=1 Tax=Wenyingzhuangia gilva TaxID=3057677 RepID=A0ABT8VNI5_9FLAO|nr:hypothetical protein [Wenyingzhuangia sp. chi5]MDO3693512.1 hypothetical protein [Wenyingzhuangia sp. chi5]
MKKKIILILLFIGPLGFFILLSLGDVNFKPCEVFKENVLEVATFKKDTTSFKDNINVITFLGTKPNLKETQLFNLNEVVFKKLDKYKKFQMISFYINKDNPEIKSIQEKLAKTAGDKFYKWKFICLDTIETTKLYQSLKTISDLDSNLASDDAFIIDKKNNQRGRTDDDKIGEDVFAYNMLSINDLKNKLLTDTENVFYEQEVATTSRKERLGKDEK